MLRYNGSKALFLVSRRAYIQGLIFQKHVEEVQGRSDCTRCAQSASSVVCGVPAGGSPYLVSRPPTERVVSWFVQTTGFRKLARTKAFYLPSTQTSLRDNFRNRSVYKDETGPRFCVALGGLDAHRVLQACLGTDPLLGALSPNGALIWLGVWRIILGIGVGGDYPMSASVATDRANVKRRGTLLAYIFSNQGWGSFVGSLAFIIVLLCYKHPMEVDGKTSKVDGGTYLS